MEVFQAKNLTELGELARNILTQTQDYSIVMLTGQLGSGKTSLIKYMCNLLGVKEAVSSPTFSLVNEYETMNGDVLYHFDFYRLNDATEALDMGVEEYFESGNKCFVEWPEMIEGLWPDQYALLSISIENESRMYTLTKTK